MLNKYEYHAIQKYLYGENGTKIEISFFLDTTPKTVKGIHSQPEIVQCIRFGIILIFLTQ